MVEFKNKNQFKKTHIVDVDLKNIKTLKSVKDRAMAKPISTRKMNSIVSISIRSISKYLRYCKKKPVKLILGCLHGLLCLEQIDDRYNF